MTESEYIMGLWVVHYYKVRICSKINKMNKFISTQLSKTVSQTSSRRSVFAFRNLCAIFALFSFSACSGNHSEYASNLPQLSAEQYIAHAVQDTSKLTSAHAHLAALGNTDDAKLLFLTGDLMQSPVLAAQGHIKIKLGGTVLESDFKVIHNVLYFKIYGDSWQSLDDASSIYDISAILNPHSGLANILQHVQNAHNEGTEKIGDHYAEKIKGVVSALVLHSLHINATGEVPVEVWIAKDPSYHLIRATIQTGPDSRTELDLSQWNDKFTITKPA